MRYLDVRKANSGVQVKAKHGRKWIALTHEAVMHQLDPLLDQKPGRKSNYSWDREPGEELSKWLEGRPWGIHYYSEFVVFELTEEDAALFKLFWT